MNNEEQTRVLGGDNVTATGGGVQKFCEPATPKSESDRLRETIGPDAMRVDLVSAFAGDREMTSTERELLHRIRDLRGDVFFSDLLYSISHHYFAPEIAEELWRNVLLHKLLISRRLDRNVRITVATLDYLSNIKNEIDAPTLISEAYISELADLSMRDGMTGLFNHSSCYELLELEIKRTRRQGVVVSFLLLDIDNFKSINDRYGHQEGDRALVELAKLLRAQTRESDICCRLGGDELGVILPATGMEGALEIAERLRISAASVVCCALRISISIGFAICNGKSMSPLELVNRADAALYQAKANGKNNVVCWEETHLSKNQTPN